MNALFHAHSGLRYLVLLAAVIAIVVLGYALATGRSVRTAQRVATIYTGLLDLQIVLGIGLVMLGLFPDAVIGHLAMMLLAAVVVHATSIFGRRSTSEQRELAFRLSGVVISLLLIVGGIMAIGRSVLGTAPPTLH